MQRILLSGWIACVFLGTSSAFVKTLTGQTGMVSWIIGAATAISLLVAFTLRRGLAGTMASLSMGISGLSCGFGVGMIGLALATHRSLPIVFAIKWLPVGLGLTLIFLSQVRDLEAPPEEFPEVDWELLKANSAEEVEARLACLRETERQQEEIRIANERELVRQQLVQLSSHLRKQATETKKDLFRGVAIFLIGVVVLTSSHFISVIIKN